MSASAKRIALFGTSADPPTAGHQAILQWLSDHYDWVAVWASDNPFKEHQTPLSHRLAMLGLLIEAIDPPRQNIGLQEELSHRRSLVSVRKAKEIWGPEADYTLAIGSDLVQQIRTWYRARELFQEVQLLVVPRPGYPVFEEDLALLRRQGATCTVADLNVPAVSSTTYRETGDKTVIPKSIKNYICREHLY